MSATEETAVTPPSLRKAGDSWRAYQLKNWQCSTLNMWNSSCTITRQAWLQTPEAYQFTVVAGVKVIERVLAGNLKGALTPSKAFGADFPLEIEGTKRWDSLPK